MPARHIIEALERDAPQPDGAGDRFSGSANRGCRSWVASLLLVKRAAGVSGQCPPLLVSVRLEDL